MSRSSQAPGGIASPIQAYLQRLHARHTETRGGEVATYIPELGRADPEWFGICLATTDGRLYEVGDSRELFTIQSISKPITYGLALEDHGRDAVLAKVGVEPSGDAFNSISLAPGTGCPLNPMINAGAIATTALVTGYSADDSLARLLAVFSRYAGRPVTIDDGVYRSEKETGHRNRAIGHMLRNFEVLSADPEAALDLYFRQCSILVDCRDLAVIAATLANAGVNPVTGDVAVRQEFVESILSVMTTCGMYDFAGEWVYAVGLPAKSGVAGGVLAVLPGQLGIGVFSPRLDAHGNSLRGVAVCKDISRDFGLHFLRPPRAAGAVIRAEYDLAHVRSRRLRPDTQRRALDAIGPRARVYGLQGDLSFAAVEGIVRRIVDAGATVDAVLLDFRRVLRIEACAVPLLTSLIADLGVTGKHLVLTGLDDHRGFLRAIEERLAATGHGDPARVFPDIDAALEWCEELLLADAPDDPRGSVLLAEHELCRGLEADAVIALARFLRPRRFESGALIVREGDPGEDLYLLMQGKVSVTVDLPTGQRRRLATLSAGMVFGEITVVDRSARTADVRADAAVECLVLPAADLDRLGEALPAVKIAILENLLRSAHLVVRRLSRELAVLAG